MLFKKRGSLMRSQPKLVFGRADQDGRMPLFRGNMDKSSWAHIKPMPPALEEVANLIGETFGEMPNHCLVNVMPDGKAHYIPAHQDQPFSAHGVKCEKERTVFIIALGMPRPLLFTTVQHLGKSRRADMEVIGEVTCEDGDLFELTGQVNSSTDHCVPQDCDITGLRMSLTFRHMEHSWVQPSTLQWWDADGKCCKLPNAAEKHTHAH